MNVHGLILPARIIGGLILLFALIPGGVGGYLYIRTAGFVDRAIAVDAEVVEMERRSGSSWATIFEFVDADGATRRVEDRVLRNPKPYDVGDRIDVLYDPGNPRDARIDSFWSLWLIPFVMACGMVPILLFGLAFLWLAPFLIRRFAPAEPAPPPLP